MVNILDYSSYCNIGNFFAPMDSLSLVCIANLWHPSFAREFFLVSYFGFFFVPMDSLSLTYRLSVDPLLREKNILCKQKQALNILTHMDSLSLHQVHRFSGVPLPCERIILCKQVYALSPLLWRDCPCLQRIASLWLPFFAREIFLVNTRK